MRCSAEPEPDSLAVTTEQERRIAERPNSAVGIDTKVIGGMDTVPRTAPPFAIAALQTSALLPSGLAVALGLHCPAAGRKAIGDALKAACG